MKNYRKGVFIVAYRKIGGKLLYLVLKRKLHWIGWEFPKGGVERGESKREAVERELKEEAKGCKIIEIRKFNVSGKYDYDKELKDRKPFTGQSYSLFSAELECSRIGIDKKEHLGYKWLDFEQAYNILTWPNQKKCLKIVNKKLKSKK